MTQISNRFHILVALATALLSPLVNHHGSQVSGQEGKWVVQESGVSDHLRDVAFVDGKKGFAVGDNQTLLKTIDGGQTWKRVISRKESDSFSYVLFSSTTEGWVVSRNVRVILHTTDGGDSWKQIPLPKEGIALKHACCISAVGSRFYYLYWGLSGTHLYTTNDAGVSWTALNDTIQVGGVSDTASMMFVDQQLGWYARFSGTPGTAYLGTTHNGGKSWSEQKLPTTWKMNVSFMDMKHGWILPNFGKLYATQDAGKTWTAQEVGNRSTQPFLDMHFIDSQTGYVVHSDSDGNTSRFQVKQTIDGGKNWKPLGGHILTVNMVKGVAFSVDGSGWVVGDNGFIAHYRSSAK